jgi:hypothetical protein
MAWSIIVVEPALSWLHGLRRADRPTLILISQWPRPRMPITSIE